MTISAIHPHIFFYDKMDFPSTSYTPQTRPDRDIKSLFYYFYIFSRQNCSDFLVVSCLAVNTTAPVISFSVYEAIVLASSEMKVSQLLILLLPPTTRIPTSMKIVLRQLIPQPSCDSRKKAAIRSGRKKASQLHTCLLFIIWSLFGANS